jgi:hypothetical protein
MKSNNEMIVERVSMESLVLDPDNARKGNIASIVESLREFGQHRPLIVQRSSNRIIAGNHTYKAAESLGWDEINVYFVDDNDTQAIRRSIADNATNDRAKWDDEILKDLMDSVGFDIPGIDEALLNRLAKLEEEPEPEPIYPIIAKPGEKYSYVVIFADTIVDVAWLETSFDFQKMASYKSQAIGSSRVLHVSKFRELLEEMSKFAKVADNEE